MEPDGMLGAIVAAESLGLSKALINGAGGCRSRAQIMLHELIPYYEYEDPEMYSSRFFSRQSRLPCTYLNNSDLVFGTEPKVMEGFRTVSKDTHDKVVILDTLGASLLCTDYSKLTDNPDGGPLVIDGDLSAMSFCEGYDRCMASLLEAVSADTEPDGSVNILGYGIQDTGWEAGAKELRSLLSAMGVKVNSIPGCMPDHGEATSCGRASLNIMLRPEFCRRTAKVLENMSGSESLRPSMGAPIGYGATRSFVIEIAETLDLDPSRALEIIDRDERSVRRVLMNFDRLPLGLHAKGFSVDGESSTVYPLVRWMHGTFGMAPRKIACTDTEYSDEIAEYVAEAGFDEPIVCSQGEEELEFTDGLTAMRGNIEGHTKGYVEIRMPRGRRIDLMGRCTIGTPGCRYILDEMFNQIRRFRCGQPTEIDYRPCRNRVR
ncbi:MAG: hypothetical protein A3205_04060 [Methanomassiliicoccales archaeon Mx-03]|nr:MAG: hypothetical protein A3205_04060 [Methanomassiliicoccales archaeon Mx-03]